MKLESHGDTLRITDLAELGAANSGQVRDEARAALGSEHKNIEVDLSATAFLDSCGLGALIALHKTACERSGNVRLLRPQPAVERVLELTRLHRVFQIIKS
jgi:anti-sigma B factor antagonist